MTKTRAILLAGVATGLVLAACVTLALWPREEEPPLSTYDPNTVYTEEESLYFEATVLRVDEDRILVRPSARTSDVMAFDEVLVHTVTASGDRPMEFTAGQEIGILFDGKVAMSLPAQVTRVFKFFSTK